MHGSGVSRIMTYQRLQANRAYAACESVCCPASRQSDHVKHGTELTVECITAYWPTVQWHFGYIKFSLVIVSITTYRIAFFTRRIVQLHGGIVPNCTSLVLCQFVMETFSQPVLLILGILYLSTPQLSGTQCISMTLIILKLFKGVSSKGLMDFTTCQVVIQQQVS